MKNEIKEATINHFIEDTTYRFNFVNYGESCLDETAVCSYIHFGLDYWDEDVTTKDISFIIGAVEEAFGKAGHDTIKQGLIAQFAA